MKNKKAGFIVLFISLGLLTLSWLTLTEEGFSLRQQPFSSEEIIVEEDSREDCTESTTDIGESQNIFADIAGEVNSSVVKIFSRQEVASEQRDFFEEDFFEYFFPGLEPEYEEGFGSGVIISEEGYIVTNEHVVLDSEEVLVEIPGVEETREAEVIWAEYTYDLALLKVAADEQIKPAPLGCSDEIRPGEWVVAIGNPFGYENTVTVGVIGALQRPFSINTRDGIRRYRDLIQTDAAINPGNSGGPLLNVEGQVIGINTAVDTTGQGLGFAIPINIVKDFVRELEETGEIARPWLGIQYLGVPETVAEKWSLSDTEGALVVDVLEGSAAAEAGLIEDDIIIEMAGQEIIEYTDLADIMFYIDVGEVVDIKIIREGEVKTLTANIGRMPDSY